VYIFRVKNLLTLLCFKFLFCYWKRLKEAEESFRQRPSRDEDVEFIKQLEEKLFQQELACQKLNDEKKYYKLELVNREENFNKIFNNNPNVGFMNPIEANRVSMMANMG